MKTLILAIIYISLVSTICFSQTLDERVTRLEQKVFGDTVIVPTDTNLIKPTYEGIVMQSFTQDKFIFNPAIKKDGLFYLYCNAGGSVKLETSPNGLNTFTEYATNSPQGSIIFVDKFYESSHRWFGGMCDLPYWKSIDGKTFTQTALDRTQQSGEDRNLLYDNGLWRNYIRVRPIPRSIGYCESTEFQNFTRIVEVLKPDAVDGALKQFYHLSVIKTAEGYFGLLNVYRVGNSGQDVEQLPPYSTDEHTVDVQLVWSANGKDNWQRLNDRKPFIERKPGIQQQFAWWSVVGSVAIIYTAESRRKHTDWENSNNSVGNYLFSSCLKIDLNNLFNYNK